MSSHSGQWSSGLARVAERGGGVSQCAERHGYQPGAVRGFWTAALCADAAKGIARLILTAAADRMDDRLPQQGRHREGFHLEAIFREQAPAGILPPLLSTCRDARSQALFHSSDSSGQEPASRDAEIASLRKLPSSSCLYSRSYNKINDLGSPEQLERGANWN